MSLTDSESESSPLPSGHSRTRSWFCRAMSAPDASGWSSDNCILVTTKGTSRIPADYLKAYLKRFVGLGASIHVTVKETDEDLQTFVHIESQQGRFYKYA